MGVCWPLLYNDLCTHHMHSLHPMHACDACVGCRLNIPWLCSSKEQNMIVMLEICMYVCMIAGVVSPACTLRNPARFCQMVAAGLMRSDCSTVCDNTQQYENGIKACMVQNSLGTKKVYLRYNCNICSVFSVSALLHFEAVWCVEYHPFLKTGRKLKRRNRKS